MKSDIYVRRESFFPSNLVSNHETFECYDGEVFQFRVRAAVLTILKCILVLAFYACILCNLQAVLCPKIKYWVLKWYLKKKFF